MLAMVVHTLLPVLHRQRGAGVKASQAVTHETLHPYINNKAVRIQLFIAHFYALAALKLVVFLQPSTVGS